MRLTRPLRATALAAAAVMATAVAVVASSPAQADWIFYDGFDGPAGSQPDASAWEQQTGCNWGDDDLKESQCYTDGGHNVALDGAGNLVITARNEPWSSIEGGDLIERDYTSARLATTTTIGSGGGIEVRAKMSGHQDGAWPAIWTVGQPEDVWPRHGELDLMENGLGGDGDWTPTYRVHTDPDGNGESEGGEGGTYATSAADPDWTGWHVYEAEWTTGPNGQVHFSIDGNWVGSHAFTVPENSPQAIVLNIAVGSWAGTPAPVMSNTLTVDYVAAW